MIRTALIEGVAWSLLWIIYVYIIVVRFPWEMLHDQIPADHTIYLCLRGKKTTDGFSRKNE